MTRRGFVTRAIVAIAPIVLTGYVLAGVLAAVQFTHVYDDRENLPDLGAFTRFEFRAVGHVYDAFDTPLIELAHEYREITP